MDLYEQFNGYFDNVHYSQWNIVGCLYWIQKPNLESTNASEVSYILQSVIKTRAKSTSLLANARRKLELVESNFETSWKRPEIQQYFDQLDLISSKKIYETPAMTNVTKDKIVFSDIHTSEIAEISQKRRQAPGEVDDEAGNETGNEVVLLKKLQRSQGSSSEVDEPTNSRAVSDKFDLDKPGEGPVKKKWLLKDGRDIQHMFEEYRNGDGKTDFFAQSYIMEIVKTAPIRASLFGDDDTAWHEVCAVMEAKWTNCKPSSSATRYLQTLMKTYIDETRQALLAPYCSTPYNTREHYDLNYINMVINKFVMFFEVTNNPLLDVDNSEGFLQAHVYSLLLDQLFFDIPEIQVVRGEKASRAVSYRKNAQRQFGSPKMPSIKLDSAFLTRDTWRVEILTMEASRTDSIEGQTKRLRDMRKLAHALKDQLDFVYTQLPKSQKHRIVDIEVFGIIVSGLEGRVYAVDLPCAGLCRFFELFRFEVPKQYDSYFLLVKSITRMLALKKRILRLLNNLKDIKSSAAREILVDGQFWSPAKLLGGHPTRPTPVTPTPQSKSARK